MRFLASIALASAIFCSAGNLFAGPASAKLSALSNSLVKEYAAKYGTIKTTLAVFSFTCEDNLERQRIGFAVSELMSHRFVADGNFTVVERGEIGKLLSEQKLQASGAVDNETAVRLGRILGAGVVLLGNIQKVDGEYQVNARLVSAETAEVLISGYTELEAEAFSNDASSYLAYVPPVQAIGIYFFYNYRSNLNNLPKRDIFYSGPGLTSSTAYRPHPFTSGIPGIGLRYEPFSKVQVDFGFGAMDKAGVRTVKENATEERTGFPAYYRSSEISSQVFMYRAMVTFQDRLWRHVKYGVGGGVSRYTFGSKPYVTPLLHARLEFFPQRRIGISLSAYYDFTAKSHSYSIWHNGDRVKLLELNKFSLEPSLCIYF